jgi:hypothetical protein
MGANTTLPSPRARQDSIVVARSGPSHSRGLPPGPELIPWLWNATTARGGGTLARDASLTVTASAVARTSRSYGSPARTAATGRLCAVRTSVLRPRSGTSRRASSQSVLDRGDVGLEELLFLSPAAGSAHLDVRSALGGQLGLGLADGGLVDVGRVLGERNRGDARDAGGAELGEGVLDERAREAVTDARREARARRDALGEAAIDGVERRAADGLVARAELGEELGRRGMTTPDAGDEVGELGEVVHGAVGDEQDAVAHPRAGRSDRRVAPLVS